MTNDLISRQAVIELVQKYHGKMPNEINHQMWKEANDLPSAQPEYTEQDMREQFNAGYACGMHAAQLERNNREFMKLAVRDSNSRPYYSIIYLEIDKNGIGYDFEGYSSYSLDVISDYLKKYFIPSAQPKIVETILSAGYTGQEVRFRIGGRLFAVRELAQ